MPKTKQMFPNSVGVAGEIVEAHKVRYAENVNQALRTGYACQTIDLEDIDLVIEVTYTRRKR